MAGIDNQQTMRLVAGAKSGNKDAVEKLYTNYSDKILQIVRKRMGGQLREKMQSMDIVQDALLGVFNNLDGFTYKREDDFIKYVSSIVENRIRDKNSYFHAQKRDIQKETRLYKQNPSSGSLVLNDPANSRLSHVKRDRNLCYDGTPSQIVAKDEELDTLYTAIHKLKPEYQNVIVLAKLQGYSHEEIAEKMGKSPEAIRKLLARALSALCQMMENVDDSHA